MKSLSIASLVAGALFATGFVSAGVQAQPEMFVTGPRDPDLRTKWVSYRDLDLAAMDDRRTLNRRVKRAVSEVCSVNDNHDSEFRCRRASWQDAQQGIALAIESKILFASRHQPMIRVIASR